MIKKVIFSVILFQVLIMSHSILLADTPEDIVDSLVINGNNDYVVLRDQVLNDPVLLTSILALEPEDYQEELVISILKTWRDNPSLHVEAVTLYGQVEESSKFSQTGRGPSEIHYARSWGLNNNGNMNIVYVMLEYLWKYEIEQAWKKMAAWEVVRLYGNSDVLEYCINEIPNETSEDLIDIIIDVSITLGKENAYRLLLAKAAEGTSEAEIYAEALSRMIQRKDNLLQLLNDFVSGDSVIPAIYRVSEKKEVGLLYLVEQSPDWRQEITKSIILSKWENGLRYRQNTYDSFFGAIRILANGRIQDGAQQKIDARITYDTYLQNYPEQLRIFLVGYLWKKQYSNMFIDSRDLTAHKLLSIEGLDVVGDNTVVKPMIAALLDEETKSIEGKLIDLIVLHSIQDDITYVNTLIQGTQDQDELKKLNNLLKDLEDKYK